MNTALHVIEQLSDFGGTPRVLLNLASQSECSRGRLVLATYLPSELQRAFEGFGAEVVNLHTQAVLPLAWKIAKEAKRVGADIIFTHHTRPLVVGALASRITGIPLVHNEHSSANYRTGVARRLASIFMPTAAMVVCNSRYTARSIRDAYKLPDEKIRLLYNPVEPRECRASRSAFRAELGIGEHEVVVGHVGGMIPSRDQATLIKAIAAMRVVVPGVRLLMIGDGPMRGELETMAGELGLASTIRFVGYTDRVGDYLEAMDIYVNPTLDEGFGIAVIEAMIAGLPVVLADSGAHPELVTDGVTGTLYPGGDDKVLGEILIRLASDNGRSPAGVPLHSAAQTRFSSTVYAEGYRALIQELAGSGVTG